jgi:hypothetical protein
MDWGVHRSWRRRAPERPVETPDVADEVAQFLGGRLLGTFSEHRESAPDCVWVSVLAHASEDLLATCAAQGGAPVGSGSRCVWDRTLSFLAQVLLDHAERTGESISLLQHDIVLPIELRMGARALAPPTLVRMMLSGLHQREAPSSDPAPTTERRV